MRRAGNVMRVADLDDGLRAREREPEVDLQRRRAVADIDFRLAARLIRIAGHDRIGRVRGMLAVDVRPRRENARSRQVIRRDHATQLDELVVPLSRVAERGDAMTELAERELRIVLDVEVRIDQAGHDRAAAEIDRLDVGGRRDRCRPDRHRRSGRPESRRGRARSARHRCRPPRGRSRGPARAAAAGPAPAPSPSRSESAATEERACASTQIVVSRGRECRPVSGMQMPE